MRAPDYPARHGTCYIIIRDLIEGGKRMRVRVPILTVLTLSLLTIVIGAFADDSDKILKEHFEFSRDVVVGNTMVKKGHYLVKFNTVTNIVSFSEGSKVVASAKATMRMNDKDFDKDEVVVTETAGQNIVTGLRLGGQKEELILYT